MYVLVDSDARAYQITCNFSVFEAKGDVLQAGPVDAATIQCRFTSASSQFLNTCARILGSCVFGCSKASLTIESVFNLDLPNRSRRMRN